MVLPRLIVDLTNDNKKKNRPVICDCCGGYGKVEDIVGYVTHEMAMDAGNLSYEGSPVYGYITCPKCGGGGLC